MTKLNRKKVEKAIPGSMGIIIAIAEKCGVTREHMSTWLHKEQNKDLLHLVHAEGERIIDIAEVNLNRMIANREFNAIKLLLTTKGKNRGYIEKQEIEHTTGKRFEVSIKRIDNGDNKDKPKSEQEAGPGLGDTPGQDTH